MSTQNLPPATPGFDGHTFEPDQDGIRLSGQMRRIHSLMNDGQWRTLHEIAAETSCLETAASARLRDCAISGKRGSADIRWSFAAFPAARVFFNTGFC